MGQVGAIIEGIRNPMITAWNGHRPCIIRNDAWTISDLDEKRAALYSSRPWFPSIGDMVRLP